MTELLPYVPIHQREGFLQCDNYKKNYIVVNGISIANRKRFSTAKSIEINDCLAYDCETFHGICRLLADSNGNYILEPTFKDCLDFLFKDASKTKCYRFFYNIDFDISAIFKLSQSNPIYIRKLRLLLKGITQEFEGYEITWLKERLFVLKKNKKVARFFDLNNFLHLKLDSAIKKYVDKNSGKDPIDGKKLNDSLDYWYDNEQDIIKYCIKDCKLTRKLGNVLIQNIKKSGLELPRSLISSASLSKVNFKKHCFTPSIHYVPQKILEASYESYAGGRFEILKRGYFEKAYLYDVNSEYPDIIRKLPSLKYGKWIRVNSINKKETIGFYKAKIFIPPNKRITTSIYKKGSVNLWITGYNEGWFTWYDLDLLREYILELTIGYEYIPSEYEYYPYKEYINELYDKKAHFKFHDKDNDLLVLPLKLTMNAFYGCCLETYKVYDKNLRPKLKAGVFFNPVYASIITAYGRWKIIKDVKPEHYQYLLAFHTDSILSQAPLPELEISEKIGAWTLENEGKCLILNTGQYQIDKKCKTRGIPKEMIKNWFKFCVKDENKDLTEREFRREKMIKIREALIQDKNLCRLNVMDDVKRSVGCNSDQKRTWKDNFKNFKDATTRYIESIPHFNAYDDEGIETLIYNPSFEQNLVIDMM